MIHKLVLQCCPMSIASIRRWLNLNWILYNLEIITPKHLIMTFHQITLQSQSGMMHPGLDYSLYSSLRRQQSSVRRFFVALSRLYSRPSPTTKCDIRGRAQLNILPPEYSPVLAKTTAIAFVACALAIRAMLLDIDYSRRPDASS